MVIAGVLQRHHHLWPQIGEAALFLASLLHMVTRDLDRPSSKLSKELRKTWAGHPDDLGAHFITGMAI